MQSIRRRRKGALRRAFPAFVAAVWLASFGPASAANDITTSPGTTVTASIPTAAQPSGILQADGSLRFISWQKVRIDVTWAVSDSAASGDWFTVPLDPRLDAGAFVPVNLVDSDGRAIANATLVTDAAGAERIRFEFTPYGGQLSNRSGTGFFRVNFASDFVTAVAAGATQVATVYGRALTVQREFPPDGLSNFTFGWWSPTEGQAIATDAVGALTQTTNPQIGWGVQLATLSPSGADWATATIVDTPGRGWAYRCDDLRLALVDYTQPNQIPLGATVTATSCSRTSLTLQVTKPLDQRGTYRVLFRSWLTVTAAGVPTYLDLAGASQLGFNPAGYTNIADVTYGTDPTVRRLENTLGRTTQGGNAVGTTLAPKVDVETYTGTWEGVTFTSRVPNLTNGQPRILPAGDHDAAPGPTVVTGASTTVRFTVTNTGNETLDNVVVTRSVAAGADFTTATCTFRGATTMPFAGLAPGATFTCLATLPAISTIHASNVTVTASGTKSRQPVSDVDAFVATPEPLVPVLTAQIVPRTPSARVRSNVNWRVIITNTGNGPANNVTVCDRLDAIAVFATRRVVYRIGTTRTSARLRVRKSVGCFTIASIPAGRSAVFLVTTKVMRTSRRRITRNLITATSAGVATARAKATVRITRR